LGQREPEPGPQFLIGLNHVRLPVRPWGRRAVIVGQRQRVAKGLAAPAVPGLASLRCFIADLSDEFGQSVSELGTIHTLISFPF